MKYSLLTIYNKVKRMKYQYLCAELFTLFDSMKYFCMPTTETEKTKYTFDQITLLLLHSCRQTVVTVFMRLK